MRIGFGSQGMVRLGSPASRDDKSFAGFEELAMPLFGSLYNFAHWLVHNQNDAEDLVQETYLKAFRSFASFQPGTNFRAWIFRILKNTFLTSCSNLERRMTVAMGSEEDFPVLPETSATPESLLIERSGNEAVRGAIEQLPVNFREVILLCDVEDASYQEIAEILSIPIGTVMSRLARARKALRELLRSSPGAPPLAGVAERARGNERGVHRSGFRCRKGHASADLPGLEAQPEELYKAQEFAMKPVLASASQPGTGF
jgi:RNA polymerase sigma factor (sigma-70 family)